MPLNQETNKKNYLIGRYLARIAYVDFGFKNLRPSSTDCLCNRVNASEKTKH